MNQLFEEIDKLRVFVVVAEKGKINSSAEALNLTQPAITRSIQKLEAAFGSKLFTRSRDGMKLTKAGELLYETASRALKSLSDVRIRAQNIDHEISGHLKIGTYESLAEYLWPDLLLEIQNLYPALHLSLGTESVKSPQNELIAGRIDILVDAEPQVSQGLISWPLYSDQFAFYMNTAESKNQYSPLTLRDISLVTVPGARDENGLSPQDHLRMKGYEFRREYFFDSFSTVKRVAAKGIGLAVLPVRLAEDDEKKKVLRRISLEGFNLNGFGRHTIYATTTEANKNELRIRKIVKLLKTNLR